MHIQRFRLLKVDSFGVITLLPTSGDDVLSANQEVIGTHVSLPLDTRRFLYPNPVNREGWNHGSASPTQDRAAILEE